MTTRGSPVTIRMSRSDINWKRCTSILSADSLRKYRVGGGVGSGVGTSVGKGVGCGVGVPVGIELGNSDGKGEGAVLGAKECVGRGVGESVGSSVGKGDGAVEGRGVGSNVGSGVGKLVGLRVCTIIIRLEVSTPAIANDELCSVVLYTLSTLVVTASAKAALDILSWNEDTASSTVPFFSLRSSRYTSKPTVHVFNSGPLVGGGDMGVGCGTGAETLGILLSLLSSCATSRRVPPEATPPLPGFFSQLLLLLK